MLEINNLYKDFDGKTILNDISFKLREGGKLGFFGENASGKTTLLKIIAGLEEESLGSVLMDGKPLPKQAHQRDVSLSFQMPVLWEHMKVKDNIAYAIKDESKKEEIISFLAKGFKIENILDSYPSDLSGGQAKRVDLARAFASGAKLILLDEPFSYIDKAGKTEIIDFIRVLSKDITLIIASHDEDLAFKLCEDYLRLEDTVIIETSLGD